MEENARERHPNVVARFPVELLDRVRQAAQAEDRSVSAFLRNAARLALERQRDGTE